MAMYTVIPKSQAECDQLVSVLHSKGFKCDEIWSWDATVIRVGISVVVWRSLGEWAAGLVENVGDDGYYVYVTPNQLSELI